MVTIEKYKAAWNEHIKDLDGLKWNLTPDQIKELKEIQSKLITIVDIAALDIETQRKRKELNEGISKAIGDAREKEKGV